MKKKIESFILKNNLIEKNDKILIALSGGADSVALFYILKDLQEEYNLDLSIVHINHNLRKTAIRDENFVKKLGKKYNVKTFILSEDIEKISKTNKIGLEEAGREVRYKYFNEIKEKEKANKVALAHNLDDNVETFMFRLMRGTSLKGLSSIPLLREFYIRPLLNTYKKDILDYLKINSYDFVEDESNEEEVYTRNKIRLNLIPYIEKNFNIKFKEKINNLIKEISHLEKGNIEFIKNYYKGNVINIEEIILENEEMQKNIIASFLREKQIKINKNKIQEILGVLHKGGTKFIDLDDNYKMKKEYKKLYLCKKEKYIIPEKKPLLIGGTLNFGKYKITTSVICGKEKTEINSIYLDYEKLEKKEIYVRTRQDGDRLNISGMNGSKKIKQLFIDLKIDRERRDQIPIFEFENEIIAVGIFRINENYKSIDESKKILKLTCVEG